MKKFLNKFIHGLYFIENNGDLENVRKKKIF